MDETSKANDIDGFEESWEQVVEFSLPPPPPPTPKEESSSRLRRRIVILNSNSI
jgi:hypothetical protein